MKRYIAVDGGKFATKIACYDEKEDKVYKTKFRTKISPATPYDFQDDALERGTVIVEYNNRVYKMGNAAMQEAELDTSKTSFIHKICTLTAIAMFCSADETDEIHVAVGMPVSEWENVEKRIRYKDYLFPKEDVHIKYMSHDNLMMPVEKTFRIASCIALPESQGALFLEDVFKISKDTVGVIDIGNLNINCTIWTGRDLDREYSLTDELGGNILISGLSQVLTSQLSRCDINTVARTLRQPADKRMLPTRNEELQKRSKKIIDDFLIDHVRRIKRCCDAKHWSLDFMPLVFIGGTTSILREEIKSIFGEYVVIPDKPEYANVLGFLRILVAKAANKEIKVSEN